MDPPSRGLLQAKKQVLYSMVYEQETFLEFIPDARIDGLLTPFGVNSNYIISSTGFARKVLVLRVLCAISVSSVSLW